MRNAVWLPLVLAFACTKHNPEACCSTADQCSSYGLSGITPCDGTDVCNSTGACVAPQCMTNADCSGATPLCVNQICVAPQCTTNADCTDQTMPFCENDVCVAACGSDGDCTSMAGLPYCATNGACVGCLDDAACAAQAPVCDSTTNACRGCQKDSECTGGVCVEATGACTVDANVIFVASFGNDTGTCTAEAPCGTLAFALPLVTATRNVIHINTSDFDPGSASIALTQSVIIDGFETGTTLVDGGVAPRFSLTQSATDITLENLTIDGGSAVNVGAGVALTLFSDTFSGLVQITSGAVAANSVTFTNGGEVISCSSGTLTIDKSTFTNSYLDSTNCTLTVQHTKFDEANDDSIGATGGLVTVQNNLFVEANDIADLAYVTGGAPGSTVRFNTFVNTSGIASDGTALQCDSTIDVTSNIFAYGTQHPHSYNPVCPTQDSLYDTVALPQYTTGSGDKVGDSSTFFADLANKDFHLGSGSPALMSAETGLPVMDDYVGDPRPNPTGSTPDMGAYEAP
jgi:hypothetical protein